MNATGNQSFLTVPRTIVDERRLPMHHTHWRRLDGVRAQQHPPQTPHRPRHRGDSGSGRLAVPLGHAAPCLGGRQRSASALRHSSGREAAPDRLLLALAPHPLSPHKEPRFTFVILPLWVLVCIGWAAGHRLRQVQPPTRPAPHMSRNARRT